MKPCAKKPGEQTGWLALTLRAHGVVPLSKEEEFPPLTGGWNRHAVPHAKVPSGRPALPVYIPQQEERPREERPSPKRHGDVGRTDCDLNLLANAFPMASADIVEACLLEAGGVMKVASALLSEIYGSSSGELLETPVEGCQVREDYLSPDEYLRQEQGIYKEHRREAMIATRAWQKAVNRAQAAYRRGDGAAANSYAREAAEKRAIAVRLQSEACGKILYANNEGKGLGVWEIDLHGLHTREAVCAVEARIAKLRRTAEAQGRRRELKVVVGSGSHSANGELRLGPALVSRFGQEPAYRFQQSGPFIYLHVPFGNPRQQ